MVASCTLAMMTCRHYWHARTHEHFKRGPSKALTVLTLRRKRFDRFVSALRRTTSGNCAALTSRLHQEQLTCPCDLENLCRGQATRASCRRHGKGLRWDSLFCNCVSDGNIKKDKQRRMLLLCRPASLSRLSSSKSASLSQGSVALLRQPSTLQLCVQ